MADVAHVALVVSLVLVLGKLGGEIAVRTKQPPVLGELVGGLVLGRLAWVATHVTNDPAVDLLAQVGVLVLLFEVGLESTVRELIEVGAGAGAVAVLGTAATFAVGFGCARIAVPRAGLAAHVFLGASITATSIGITARVFKDLGRTRSIEARTILGAAVLDDVLGLVVLALVTGWIRDSQAGRPTSTGAFAWLLAKTLGLLVLAIGIGVRVSPRLFYAAAKLRAPGALLAMGLAFCFFSAWGANALGLAPIVGAFAAGLVLEELHSEQFVARGEKSLTELVEPISDFLVPIFFVVMGMRADVSALAHPGTLGLAALLFIGAVLGKLACGVGAGSGTDRLVVALGMMPRGEVTLIFASLGLSLGVLDRGAYSAVVVVVVLTTVLTPPALKWRFGRAAST